MDQKSDGVASNGSQTVGSTAVATASSLLSAMMMSSRSHPSNSIRSDALVLFELFFMPIQSEFKCFVYSTKAEMLKCVCVRESVFVRCLFVVVRMG